MQDTKFEYCLTDLQLAIKHDRRDTLQYILTEKPKWAHQAVDYAIIANKVEILRMVLSIAPECAYGYKVHLQLYNFPLVTAEHLKHRDCFTEIAKAMKDNPLLKELGNVNYSNNFSINGQVVHITGFNINPPESLQTLGLNLATSQNQLQACKYLLSAGANPNSRNMDYITKAIEHKNADMIHTLLIYKCKYSDAYSKDPYFVKGWQLFDDERLFQKVCLTIAVLETFRKKNCLPTDIWLGIFKKLNPQISESTLESISKKLSFFSEEAKTEIEQKKCKQAEAQQKAEALEAQSKIKSYIDKVTNLTNAYSKFDFIKPAYYSLKPLIPEINKVLEKQADYDLNLIKNEIETMIEDFLVNLDPELNLQTSWEIKYLYTTHQVISKEQLDNIEEKRAAIEKKPKENCMIQ